MFIKYCHRALRWFLLLISSRLKIQRVAQYLAVFECLVLNLLGVLFLLLFSISLFVVVPAGEASTADKHGGHSLPRASGKLLLQTTTGRRAGVH